MKNNITLRALEEKDAPLMLEWIKDADINRYFQFDNENASIDSVLEFIKNSKNMVTNAHFAIINEKDKNDEYFGTASLKEINLNAKNAEYAIALRKEAQGKGYGYAATVKILEYAFYTLGLERVYLNVLSDNKNAVKFYEDFGFIYEGEFFNHISIHNKIHSLKYFRLLKREYESIEKITSVNTINDVQMLEFPELGDERGHLVVIEGEKNIPFDIKRIFYIYGSDPNVIRGQHANRRSEFCLINVSGTSKVKVIDRSGNEKIINLDRPHIGVYLPTMIWKDMYDFSSDSVLLVLSNEYYDKDDYIRNYDDFIKG
jgi:RimJ/RimL family protein N-acetyltransferase/dTDP-4-dehydrorhamnose 3,5-epimerase-like enzyme